MTPIELIVAMQLTFACINPTVIDGDTMYCGQQRVRLYGYDAPELGTLSGYIAKQELRNIVSNKTSCKAWKFDVYNRVVATCWPVGRTGSKSYNAHMKGYSNE